jgi:hypothetical protein
METLISGHAGGFEAEVAIVDETLVGELAACVTHRLSSSYARARLAEALYEIVLDGLHPCPRSLPDPADRAWLREALARPIEAATDEALLVLVARTLDAFEEAPEAVVSCLVERAR